MEEVEEGNSIPEGAPPLALPREDCGNEESGEEFQVGTGWYRESQILWTSITIDILTINIYGEKGVNAPGRLPNYPLRVLRRKSSQLLSCGVDVQGSFRDYSMSGC